jgi:hypothetical protein
MRQVHLSPVLRLLRFECGRRVRGCLVALLGPCISLCPGYTMQAMYELQATVNTQ